MIKGDSKPKGYGVKPDVEQDTLPYMLLRYHLKFDLRVCETLDG